LLCEEKKANLLIEINDFFVLVENKSKNFCMQIYELRRGRETQQKNVQKFKESAKKCEPI
jgi:hypothetical protein